jgi:hypothetical protein
MSSQRSLTSHSMDSLHQKPHQQPPGQVEVQPVQKPEEALLLKKAWHNPHSLVSSDVAHLQRRVGNRAVNRMIQAKMTVGPAADSYEQEADRIAAQVVSAPAPQAQTSPGNLMRQPEEEEIQAKPLAASVSRLVQRAAEEEEEVQAKRTVQRAAEEEEEVQAKRTVQRAAEEKEEVQAKFSAQRAAEEEEEVQAQRSSSADGFAVDGDFENQVKSASGSGKALPAEERTFMESRFGADFSGVRVHTGGQSDHLNRSIQARAFTSGGDIFFRSGEYSPGTSGGRELLAHELTHTIQQGAASVKTSGQAGGQPAAKVQPSRDVHVQRKSVTGVTTMPLGAGGTFDDIGNGMFGSTKPITATDVTNLIRLIRASDRTNNTRTNIKVLTGTHGSSQGHLIGEEVFYKEDIGHEGHKADQGGWINVLKVLNKSKDTIGGWKDPGGSAVILAWCYSAMSQANWANLHAYWKKGSDGKWIKAW